MTSSPHSRSHPPLQHPHRHSLFLPSSSSTTPNIDDQCATAAVATVGAGTAWRAATVCAGQQPGSSYSNSSSRKNCYCWCWCRRRWSNNLEPLPSLSATLAHPLSVTITPTIFPTILSATPPLPSPPPTTTTTTTTDCDETQKTKRRSSSSSGHAQPTAGGRLCQCHHHFSHSPDPLCCCSRLARLLLIITLLIALIANAKTNVVPPLLCQSSLQVHIPRSILLTNGAETDDADTTAALPLYLIMEYWPPRGRPGSPFTLHGPTLHQTIDDEPEHGTNFTVQINGTWPAMRYQYRLSAVYSTNRTANCTTSPVPIYAGIAHSSPDKPVLVSVTTTERACTLAWAPPPALRVTPETEGGQPSEQQQSAPAYAYYMEYFPVASSDIIFYAHTKANSVRLRRLSTGTQYRLALYAEYFGVRSLCPLELAFRTRRRTVSASRNGITANNGTATTTIATVTNSGSSRNATNKTSATILTTMTGTTRKPMTTSQQNMTIVAAMSRRLPALTKDDGIFSGKIDAQHPKTITTTMPTTTTTKKMTTTPPPPSPPAPTTTATSLMDNKTTTSSSSSVTIITVTTKAPTTTPSSPTTATNPTAGGGGGGQDNVATVVAEGNTTERSKASEDKSGGDNRMAEEEEEEEDGGDGEEREEEQDQQQQAQEEEGDGQQNGTAKAVVETTQTQEVEEKEEEQSLATIRMRPHGTRAVAIEWRVPELVPCDAFMVRHRTLGDQQQSPTSSGGNSPARDGARIWLGGRRVDAAKKKGKPSSTVTTSTTRIGTQRTVTPQALLPLVTNACVEVNVSCLFENTVSPQWSARRVLDLRTPAPVQSVRVIRSYTDEFFQASVLLGFALPARVGSTHFQFYEVHIAWAPGKRIVGRRRVVFRGEHLHKAGGNLRGHQRAAATEGRVNITGLEPARLYTFAVRNVSRELPFHCSAPLGVRLITPPVITSTVYAGQLSSQSININFGDSDPSHMFEHYELHFGDGTSTGTEGHQMAVPSSPMGDDNAKFENGSATTMTPMIRRVGKNDTKSFTFNKLVPGKTYTFALFTLFHGVRSRPVDVNITTYPLKVSAFHPLIGPGYVRLFWTVRNDAHNLCHFRLSYTASAGPHLHRAKSLALNGSIDTHRFSSLDWNTFYTFTITVIMGPPDAEAESESEAVTIGMANRPRSTPQLKRYGSRELLLSFENDPDAFPDRNGAIHEFAVIVAEHATLEWAALYGSEDDDGAFGMTPTKVAAGSSKKVGMPIKTTMTLLDEEEKTEQAQHLRTTVGDVWELSSWHDAREQADDAADEANGTPWIAYRTSPSNYNPFARRTSPRVAQFVIGAEDCVPGRRPLDEMYCNGALRANMDYFVRVRAFSVAGVAMETAWVGIGGAVPPSHATVGGSGHDGTTTKQQQSSAASGQKQQQWRLPCYMYLNGCYDGRERGGGGAVGDDRTNNNGGRATAAHTIIAFGTGLLLWLLVVSTTLFIQR